MSTEYTGQDHQMKTLFQTLTKYIKENNLKDLKTAIDASLLDITKIKNTKNSTLLHIAARYNRDAIAAYLIENNLSVHEQNSKNECPYYVAVLWRSEKVLKCMEKEFS